MNPAQQPAPNPDDEYVHTAAHDSAPDIPVGTTIPHGEQWDVQDEVYADPLDFDDEHLTRLGLTLDFGPADLDANRAGVLSDAQIARLERDLRLTYWPLIGVLAALALFVGIAGAAAGTLMLFPMLFLMLLALIPGVILSWQRTQLPDQPVKRTTLRVGGLSLMARRFGFVDEASATGKINLPVQGGKKLFAPQHLYKVINSSRTYVVYYTPVFTWAGYRALSIEPGDDAPPRAPRKVKRKAKRG